MIKFTNAFIDNEQTEFRCIQLHVTFLFYPHTPTRVNVSISKKNISNTHTHTHKERMRIRQNRRTRKKQNTKTICKENRVNIKESPEQVKLKKFASILGD